MYENILNEREMRLCVLIPTYNRSGAISYYLENQLNIFQNNHFDIIVYDSSEDDLTRVAVQNYIEQGFNCLKYVRYRDPEGDTYGNQKVIDAFNECANIYDYVWLCGDTTILLVDKFKDELDRLLNEQYDLIHIYTNKMNMKNKTDMDCYMLFENFFWSMTHWCSFILSGQVIKKMRLWMEKYLQLNLTTVIVFAIFAALENENFKIAYINHPVYRYSPWRIVSTSHKNKDILRGYAECIDIGISNLPCGYDKWKSIAKKSFNKNTGLFSKQGAIDLRADGSLTCKNVLKYSRHLNQVTDVSVAWFYFWCIIPKWFARKISHAYFFTVVQEQKLLKLSENNSRLIIYGAGEHGTKVLEKIKYLYQGIQVVAIADKNRSKMDKSHYNILPSDICKYSYDYVGVTIISEKIYKEVRKYLISLGISRKQIFHI